MQHFSPKNIDTAFVQPGTALFSDVIKKLQNDPDLSHDRKRDLVSAVRRTAKALQRPPETIPADPRWLQPRITNIVPASLSLSSKSWSNLRSDLKAALAQVGITNPQINRKANLTEDWEELWEAVLASGDRTLKASLSRFVYFLNGQGVRPEAVRSEHGLAFRDALVVNEA